MGSLCRPGFTALWIFALTGPGTTQSFPNQGSGEAAAAPLATQRSPGVDKEEDHRPVDPDTGKSTLSHKTLGLLPNPFEEYGVKFSATYISDAMGNWTGGLRQGATYEGRLNLAVDVD